MAQEIRDVDQINERLAEISLLIFPDGLRLYYADVDELREQNVNPRSMPQKMFEQLTENIQGAETLESAPLCVRVGDGIDIISGHHRVRAARAAGVKHILVFLYEELSCSRIKSKQLAHNTISGQDDAELVARVWQEITDIQARFEAFVDPRLFKDVPEPVKFTQVDVDLVGTSRTVVIAFLPIQMTDFDAAVEAIVPKAEADAAYIADREIYEGWRQALHRVRNDMDVVAIPTAIAEMARLALEALDARAAADGEA